MTRQSPPELFAQRPVRSDFGRRQQRSMGRMNWARLFALVGLLGALAVGGGFLLSSLGGDEQAPEAIPHIKAEGPIKEKPENPGGIDIPHQDVQVFRELDARTSAAANPQGGGIEHLLPAPETPQPVAAEAERPESAPQSAKAEVLDSIAPPPVAVAAPAPVETAAVLPKAGSQEALPDTQEVAAAPDTFEAKPVEQPAAPTLQPVQEPKKAAKPPAKKQEPAKTVQPSAPKAAAAKTVEQPNPDARLPSEMFTTIEPVVPAQEEKAAPASSQTADKPAVRKSTGPSVRIQLASLPDQDAAQKTAQKLQARHADSLGGATLTVIKAEIAGKGTYYRVMSGPLPEMQAKTICAELSQKKAACLVAR